MSNLYRIISIGTIGGLLIAGYGCFLPWTEITWPPFIMSPSEIKIGVQLLFGAFAFVACVFTTFFQILRIATRNWFLSLFVVAGGLLALTFSGVWILQPGIFESSSSNYKALYGAYVTVAGSAVAIRGIIDLSNFGTINDVFKMNIEKNV